MTAINNLKRIVLFVVIAIAVLLPSLFLNPWDGIVFKGVAFSWVKGGIPYLDFFDHKGPIIYLLNLVYVYGGDRALFLLEVLFLTWSMELIYRCGKLLKTSQILNYVSVFVAVFLFAAYFEGGNLTEEWSLPFELLSLYLVMKLLLCEKHSYSSSSFICGLCFGVVCMQRLNNNALIVGLAVAELIILMRNKQYSTLGMSIFWFTIGMLCVMIPFVLYFYCVGALDWMVHSNLFFNLLYKQNWDIQYNLLGNCIRLLPCFVLPIIAYCVRRTYGKSFIVIACSVSFVSFCVFIDSFYSHYFIMIIPLVALCIQATNTMNRLIRVVVCVLMLSTIKISGARKLVETYSVIDIRKPSITKCKNKGTEFIIKYIPEVERDSIYTCNLMEALGAVNESGHKPIGKYTFLQNNLGKVDDKVSEDIKDQFYKSNPKWIIFAGSLEPSIVTVCGIDLASYKIISHDSIPEVPINWFILQRKNNNK